MADPAGRLEHVRRVIRDDVDAVELRQGLRRHGDEDALAVPLEHVGVGPFALLARDEHVHLDVAEHVPRAGVVDVAAAVEVGDDYYAFFVVVVVEQPSVVTRLAGSYCDGVAKLTSVTQQ